MDSGDTRWRPPRLIVLSRGTPEEAILSSCKGGAVVGPVSAVAGCFESAGASNQCKNTPCTTQVAS